MVSSKRFWKQTWKEQKSMSCRIIKIRRGVTLSESVFQRFMGTLMLRYTCLIKKIIMCFKILFVCKFTVKRVKRIFGLCLKKYRIYIPRLFSRKYWWGIVSIFTMHFRSFWIFFQKEIGKISKNKVFFIVPLNHTG